MTKSIIALTIASAALLYGCGAKEQVIKPERKPMVVAVYASGELEPAEVYRSFATVSGIVQEVFVQEGDTVPVDAPLIRLKSENVDYNVQNARLAMQMAQYNAAGDTPVFHELQVQID
jgi:multidrug efflux pump subunit AcrA (membrane-fusion protein)